MPVKLLHGLHRSAIDLELQAVCAYCTAKMAKTLSCSTTFVQFCYMVSAIKMNCDTTDKIQHFGAPRSDKSKSIYLAISMSTVGFLSSIYL